MGQGMNVFIAEKVIAAVQQLLDGNIPNRNHGICYNVKRFCVGIESELVLFCLHDVAELWPKYSGDSCYPVPDPSGDDHDPVYVYQTTLDEWEEGTAYTALRIELCRFIIDYLKRYYNLK